MMPGTWEAVVLSDGAQAFDRWVRQLGGSVAYSSRRPDRDSFQAGYLTAAIAFRELTTRGGSMNDKKIMEVLAQAGYEAMVEAVGSDKDVHNWENQGEQVKADWVQVARAIIARYQRVHERYQEIQQHKEVLREVLGVFDSFAGLPELAKARELVKHGS